MDKPSIVIFFPVYDDESTVEKVAMKSINVLSDIASRYKVVIVDDGSPDKSGEIADELSKKYPEILSIRHSVNKGYGAALMTGFKHSMDYDWICFTDGDDQYDVNELYHITKLLHHYDMIVSFRYTKIYGTFRIFMSYIYNLIIRLLFKSKFRDHNCGLKLIRSSTVANMNIESVSPFVGAELIIRTMVKGYPIGEVGIRTYPRTFGESHSTSFFNIYASIRDMIRIYRQLFRIKNTP